MCDGHHYHDHRSARRSYDVFGVRALLTRSLQTSHIGFIGWAVCWRRLSWWTLPPIVCRTASKGYLRRHGSLALHDGIHLDLNQPIRIDKTHNLHDGVGGTDAAKELAVNCRDLFPILYTG